MECLTLLLLPLVSSACPLHDRTREGEGLLGWQKRGAKVSLVHS